MSASMNLFSIINNLSDLKQILMPEKRTKQERNRDDDWDNRWNWDTSELINDDKNDDDNDFKWLNECIITISPFYDLLVIGRHQIISIFHSKQLQQQQQLSSLNNSNHQYEFNSVYTTTLPELENDEIITSIVLSPFVSNKKSVVNFRDWTAIMIGFSSGYFRIYSENGKFILLSYLFHQEPIMSIKCRTYSINNLLNEQMDEILIIYPSAVIQIDGFSLFQSLKLSRARLMKSDDNSFFQSSYNSSDQQTPFTFKKWTFDTPSDGQIFDCVNVCSFSRNDFDALVSHSIDDCKPIANDHANLFLTTGTNPYIGFYRAQEGTTHAIMDELSQYLMNKVKNVFSFFNNQQSKSSNNVKDMIKPSTNVPIDLALFDERLGNRICLSPNRRLAAVTDDFGRVILFDMQNLIAIRIWKGYRKAEIGWIVVDENSDQQHSNHNDNHYCKQALFLIIYVPKRGILEIWCTQNGPRVTAFNVGKNCKLLYLDHQMFGLNYLILQSIKQTLNNQDEYRTCFQYSRCLLFNYDNCKLYQFHIPFLCSMTDKNSKKTRDIHIMKDLKNLLKKFNEELMMMQMSEDVKEKYYSNILKLILMIKTSEIKHETIEILCHNCNDPYLIEFIMKKLLNELSLMNDKNELDFENKLLIQMCRRIIQLCQCYIRMKENYQNLNIIINGQRTEQTPDINNLMNKLEGWSGSDIVRIVSLFEFRNSILRNDDNLNNAADDDVDASNSITIIEMLSHFKLYYNYLFKTNRTKTKTEDDQEKILENLPLELALMQKDTNDMKNNRNAHNDNNDFSQKNLDKLSKFLFFTTFYNDNDNNDNIEFLLHETNVKSSNLLLLLFNSWLQQKSMILDSNCWIKFSQTFNHIINTIMINIKDDDSNNHDKMFNFINIDNDDEEEEMNSNWKYIFELIYNSTNIPAAFIAINMIKVFINRIKNQNYKSNKQSNDDDVENKDNEDAETNMAEKSTNDEDITSSPDNEWETLHLDKENLNLLSKQLEDLFLLDLLLKSCKNDEISFASINNKMMVNLKQINSISLSFILTSGPGIVSEIVARWALYHDIDPKLFIDHTQIGIDSLTLNCDDTNESNCKDDTNKNNLLDNLEHGSNAINEMAATLKTESTLIEILNHVRRCFPNCLDSDILLINCFWELLLQWNQQPTLIEISKSLKYLENVQSFTLKHNVSTMAFRLFILKRFETLCNLIEKMGKKPKDRIIRKELEMDENNLEQFINFTCQLLDFMIRTSVQSQTEAMPLYTMYDWWNRFNSFNINNNTDYMIQSMNNNDFNFKSKQMQQKISDSAISNNNIPLAIMAINQKMANIDLLIEYYYLAQTLQLIVIFSIKNARPLSLFPSSIRAYFFKDLSTFILFDNGKNQDSILNDPVISQIRGKFLMNTITSIVQTIPSYRNNNNNNNDDNEQQIQQQQQHQENCKQFYISSNEWFNKIIQLSIEWNLDADNLRLHYVHELFLYGCDPLAQELISTVSNKKNLACKLLIICGMRLCSILNLKYSSLDEISFIPPNILFWIKSLIIDPNCFTDVPVSSSILLLEKISNFLYDNNSNIINSDNNAANTSIDDHNLANYRICEELLIAFKRFV